MYSLLPLQLYTCISIATDNYCSKLLTPLLVDVPLAPFPRAVAVPY